MNCFAPVIKTRNDKAFIFRSACSRKTWKQKPIIAWVLNYALIRPNVWCPKKKCKRIEWMMDDWEDQECCPILSLPSVIKASSRRRQTEDRSSRQVEKLMRLCCWRGGTGRDRYQQYKSRKKIFRLAAGHKQEEAWSENASRPWRIKNERRNKLKAKKTKNNKTKSEQKESNKTPK